MPTLLLIKPHGWGWAVVREEMIEKSWHRDMQDFQIIPAPFSKCHSVHMAVTHMGPNFIGRCLKAVDEHGLWAPLSLGVLCSGASSTLGRALSSVKFGILNPWTPLVMIHTLVI